MNIEPDQKIGQLVHILRSKHGQFLKVIEIQNIRIAFRRDFMDEWGYIRVTDLKTKEHKMFIDIASALTHKFRLYYLREIYFIKWLNKNGFLSIDHFLDYLIYQII